MGDIISRLYQGSAPAGIRHYLLYILHVGSTKEVQKLRLESLEVESILSGGSHSFIFSAVPAFQATAVPTGSMEEGFRH